MSNISQKTEKIASALYLLTSFFSDQEPLKWEIRVMSLDLASERVKDKFNIIREILSLLSIARMAGLVSESNYEIIAQELSKFGQSMESPLKLMFLEDRVPEEKALPRPEQLDRIKDKFVERMEKKESGRERGAPPEYLSTHPGYETRTQQLRSWIPEAMKYYQPEEQRVEFLPSSDILDSPVAKAERELLKRIRAINQQAEDPRGERAVVEAIGYSLRMQPSIAYQERQQLKMGYGQYAALRALSSMGRSPLRRVVTDYERGVSWSEVAQANGTRLTELLSWMGELRRTAAVFYGQLRSTPQSPGYRTR